MGLDETQSYNLELDTSHNTIQLHDGTDFTTFVVFFKWMQQSKSECCGHYGCSFAKKWK